MRNMFSHYSRENKYSTNVRGPKKNWVPKVKKLIWEADISYSSKSKC